MKNKAIILDLDDTLYSEIDFLYSAYKYIALRLEPANWNTLFHKLVDLYSNGDNTFHYLVEQYHIKLPVLLDWYRFHFPEITLFPDVKESLCILKKEHKLAVITDGRSISQRNKLRALGVDSLLDAILISEEIGSEKPALRNFTLVQEILQCNNYVYIGDNLKKDFITPKKLGWKTICLKDNGKNIHKQNFNIDDEFLPHFYISKWSEVLSVLQNASTSCLGQ